MHDGAGTAMRFKMRSMLLCGALALLALSGSAIGRPAPLQLPSNPPLPIAKPKEIAQRSAPMSSPREPAPVERVSLAAGTWKSAFGMPALVAEARKYMGTNPTARTRLWCATFMNFVLAKLGYAGTNSDAARSFAYYGRRISEPEIGAIAVLTRGKNGGHVGVVSGIDSQGNPIIISGNHNKRVGEAVYARSRVIAYVMPTERRLAPTMVAAARSPAGTSSSDAGPDLRLESPITELLAAIEAEQVRAETPRAASVQRQPRRPVAPHRLVQQTPEQPQRQAVPRSGSNPFAELASYIERKR